MNAELENQERRAKQILNLIKHQKDFEKTFRSKADLIKQKEKQTIYQIHQLLMQ